MKKCSKCNMPKPETDFFMKDKSKGKLHAQCKACYANHRKSYHKQHYNLYRESYIARAKKRRETLRQDYRNRMLNYLENKQCTECGEQDIRTFEFAHVDAATKEFSISQAVRLGYNWLAIEEEIKKCRILCANCHKKETAEQFGWYKT